MIRYLALIVMMLGVAGCSIDLPPLVITRTIHLEPSLFEEVEAESDTPAFGLTVPQLRYPDGLATYDPVSETITLFPDLEMSPGHRDVLSLDMEVIHVGDIMARGLMGRRGSLCFSHQYDVVGGKRLTDSKAVPEIACWKTLGVPFAYWTDIAVWVLQVLNLYDTET